MAQGEFTVGLEEEFQLVDPETGALEGRAPELLETPGIAKAEYQRTMLEIETPVCLNAAAAGRRIGERRGRLARLAAEHGLAIAAAGLHPLGPYPGDQLTAEPENRRIAERGGARSRELHIFGLHVHVAVPSREAGVRAMLGAAPFIPHLLTLSASSPFHAGEDTGYASYRTVLRDFSPRVGLPLPVLSAVEYDELERILAGGPVQAGRNSPVAWDIRPSPHFPTVEFRFLDVVPWLDTVTALAALARALVAMYADRPPAQPTGTELQLLRENRWRAARYGLDAHFYRLGPVTGEEASARGALAALVERLSPIAERLGDADALGTIPRLLERDTAATAMRAVYAETGSLPAVTRWVVAETERYPAPAGQVEASPAEGK